jgi:hypothetical protein
MTRILAVASVLVYCIVSTADRIHYNIIYIISVDHLALCGLTSGTCQYLYITNKYICLLSQLCLRPLLLADLLSDFRPIVSQSLVTHTNSNLLDEHLLNELYLHNQKIRRPIQALKRINNLSQTQHED